MLSHGIPLLGISIVGVGIAEVKSMPYLMLYDYYTNGAYPAQLMFCQSLRTLLHMIASTLQPTLPVDISRKIKQLQQNQAYQQTFCIYFFAIKPSSKT